MIRYVMEDRDLGSDLEGTEIRSVSNRESIINAEMQIMTSQDVLINVAESDSLTNVIARIVDGYQGPNSEQGGRRRARDSREP